MRRALARRDVDIARGIYYFLRGKFRFEMAYFCFSFLSKFRRKKREAASCDETLLAAIFIREIYARRPRYSMQFFKQNVGALAILLICLAGGALLGGCSDSEGDGSIVTGTSGRLLVQPLNVSFSQAELGETQT